MPLSQQARLLSACAPLSWGDLYCLGFGFVTKRPDHRAALRPSRYEPTGDLSFRDWVARRAALPRRERLVEQRDEAVNASLGVDKARSLSRMVEGPEREWPDEL
ncbi:hypothetical protein [Nocardioides lijunqiniae]|uniref:hypothetical protein n=1 Tax=Nocardioides lijunqiniae TaxID=2760832 RepID=UPI00187788E6|nr:hypothetical protein [Nocardioides lijunqiniae]